MVWYQSPTDVIKTNKIAVRKNKHPYKLLRSIEAIQAAIESVKKSESKGLTYQAARFMKELTTLHAFDGGNDRTAYSIANLFLLENGASVRIVSASLSHAFVKGIARKEIEDVREWIEQCLVQRHG